MRARGEEEKQYKGCPHAMPQLDAAGSSCHTAERRVHKLSRRSHSQGTAVDRQTDGRQRKTDRQADRERKTERQADRLREREAARQVAWSAGAMSPPAAEFKDLPHTCATPQLVGEAI